MRPDVVWAALIGAPVTVELVAFAAGAQQWMLSPHARRWTRTDTAAGRALVTVGIGAGATWLAHHWITPAD